MNDEEIRETLRAYARLVVPDERAGFTAQILEFPGCLAEGETEAEALENLESVAESWLEGANEEGMPIPAPIFGQPQSGRIALRLPRSLHRRASELAQADGISLNAFLVAAISEKVGSEGATVEKAAKRLEDSVAAMASERRRLEEAAANLDSLLERLERHSARSIWQAGNVASGAIRLIAMAGTASGGSLQGEGVAFPLEGPPFHGMGDWLLSPSEELREGHYRGRP